MSITNERELELLALRNIMNTEPGRGTLWRMLQSSGILGNSFSNDASMNAFYSGAREQGMWLTREMKEAAPDKYLLMLKEHEDE